MRTWTIAAALLAGVAFAPQAQAIGCLSGAVAGGVAGHYAGHHGVIGALGGCVAGHHLAKERKLQKRREHQMQQQTAQPVHNNQ